MAIVSIGLCFCISIASRAFKLSKYPCNGSHCFFSFYYNLRLLWATPVSLYMRMLQNTWLSVMSYMYSVGSSNVSDVSVHFATITRVRIRMRMKMMRRRKMTGDDDGCGDTVDDFVVVCDDDCNADGS